MLNKSIFRIFKHNICKLSNISYHTQRSVLTTNLLNAKERKNVTFHQLSQMLNVNKVWITSVILGQHPANKEVAESLLKILETDENTRNEDIKTLCKIPENRGEKDKTLTKDPIIRRFDELLDVYGDVFKHIIREEAGDGIMSAIDCTVNLQTVPKDDHIRIVLNVSGKFLKYNH